LNAAYLIVLTVIVVPACAPLSEALEKIDRTAHGVDRTNETVGRTIDTAERAGETAKRVKEAAGGALPDELVSARGVSAGPQKATEMSRGPVASSASSNPRAAAVETAEAALRMAEDAETPEEAERLLRESIRLHPTADAWNNLACILRWRGDTIEARTSFQRALALDPTHVKAKGNLEGLDRHAR